MFRKVVELAVLPEMFGSRPPAAPRVLVDSRVTTKPEQVGFDFDVFYDLARSIGYSNDDISTYTQRYTGSLSRNRHSGQHRGRTSNVDVLKIVRDAPYAAKQDMQKLHGARVFQDTSIGGLINSAAIHEFGHDVDARKYSGMRDARVAIARHFLSRAVVYGSAIEAAGLFIAHAPKPEIAVSGAGFIALAGVAQMTHSMQDRGPYINRPTEGFAVRFQEQHEATRIVNFDPSLLTGLESANAPAAQLVCS